MSNTYRHKYEAKTKKYMRDGLNVSDRYGNTNHKHKGRGFVGCSCVMCRNGLHLDSTVRQKVRGNRRKVRQQLHRGDYENIMPTFSVGFTD